MTATFSMDDMVKLSWQMGLMVVEAQAVVTLRTLGMMGVLTPHPMENQRMVTEKSAAFAESAQAAALAAISGKQPHEVAAAALKPIRERTSANVARLSRAAHGKG